MELFPPHNKVFHLVVLAPFGFLVYLSPYQAPEACFLFKPGRSLNSSFPSEPPAVLSCVLQTPGSSSSPRVNHLQVSSGQGWSWVGLRLFGEIVIVQLLSHGRLFATSWVVNQRGLVGCCLWVCAESDTAEVTWQQQQQQASLSFTVSQNLLELMSIESVMLEK